MRFLARGPGYAVGLSASASTVVLGEERAVVRTSLLGANADSSGSAEGPLEGKVQYFIGNSPERWRTGIPTYGRVRFSDVYPGIDLIYYGNQRQLEYDFELSPGANPSRIRLSFEGTKSLRIDANGDLVLGMAKGELRHHRPRAHQRQDGVERPIAAGYRVIGPREVHIEVAAYDRSLPLTIDPVLSYSTYLGGFRNDRAWGMAVDASGCAYLVGESLSTNFPAANALQAVNKGNTDVFVTKLNASGTGMVFSTYLGGADVDVGSGIAVDGAGNIYITGYTRSAAFPVTVGAYRTTKSGGEDAFVAKLAPTGGSLIYSTFVGASGNDRAQAIAVDASGNAHIAGYTTSVTFPRVSAAQATFGGATDAFASKLNASGSALVYSTYLGGSSNDTASGIAVDGSGNAYIAGQTQSSNFPVRSAYQTNKAGSGDAFVVKLSAAGAFIFSTYLGGKSVDSAKAIALDASSNIYLTGSTYSIDFPTSTGAFQRTKSGEYDAFITKMNSAGTALVWSTYLGGAESDEGTAIAVDGSGIPYVAGFTASPNFPVSNACQPSFGGLRDAFVAVLTSAGSALQYSTYLGGSGDDRAQAIAVGGSSVYVAGYTLSTDFPTTAGALFLNHAGSTDAFSARLGGLAVMTSPVPGSILTGTTATFTWTKGGGAFSTYLQIGTTPGGSDLANTVPSTTTVSYTATNMPFNGSTVYVRLWSLTGTIYEYYDYTYIAGVPTKAAMISPTPGSVLTSALVTFTWTPGAGVSMYALYFGTTPGGRELLEVNTGTGTSYTITLPASGVTVYVRLWSCIGGGWVFNDYTYTAATRVKATMISPTPGSVLVGASVTFTWNAGTGVSMYALYFGTTPGGQELLGVVNTGTSTSYTATLPTTPGLAIHVRLWSCIDGLWVFNDYAYTR
ncbi:MAG: SBBP repeat-containing protein [Acidobacteria bacterium]|nr:SBBP repeat-containing protein [Acidobacteriota bacterium]